MERVAIIDSGSGGCNILAECVKQKNDFNYLLYIDDKNLPYGDKTEEEILQIGKNNIEFLEKIFSPEIIIIACNTLTSVCLDKLQEMYPNKIFIGSYPQIEEAENKYKDEELLLMATPITVNKLKTIKCKIIAKKELPKIIDNNLFNRKKIINKLNKILPKNNFKGIILGCTHYEGIKDELSVFYGDVEFFENGKIIANKIKKYSKNNKLNIQIKTSSGNNICYFFNYFVELINN